VIVVDSSAWIEFFRRTGSSAHLRLRELIREGAELAVTEVVVMEVLAGSLSNRHLAELRGRLYAYPLLALGGLSGYEAAAELFRVCRARGEQIRKITDCLVAVPTIEADATLLQADRDFEVLARHTALRLEPV
jgi:predicted nucleic acid-binding protein